MASIAAQNQAVAEAVSDGERFDKLPTHVFRADLGAVQKAPMEYGLELEELYHEGCMGIWDLFVQGATGLLYGTGRPLSLKDCMEIADSPVTLPGMYSEHGEFPPQMTTGGNAAVTTALDVQVPPFGERDVKKGRVKRLVVEITNFRDIIGPDGEGAGTVAVTVLHTLLKHGYIPIHNPDGGVPENPYIIDQVFMRQNKTLRIHILAHESRHSTLPIPLDELGIPKLESVRQIMEVEHEA